MLGFRASDFGLLSDFGLRTSDFGLHAGANRVEATRRGRHCRAFTMVEIALCIAVIGFALVAIVGVLPKGMQTQRDNRADTIIGQEGAFWMEAIRSGSEGIIDLVPHVESIEILESSGWVGMTNYTTSREIIGLLSTPHDDRERFETRAIVRALSGSAVEQSSGSQIGFRYRLTIRNVPATSLSPSPLSDDPKRMGDWSNFTKSRVRDLHLRLAWPVLSGGEVGAQARDFRVLATGSLAYPESPVPEGQLYFFKP